MDSWSRLYEVIRWSGMTTNAFAYSIGLKRSENLYQIKKGKNEISKDLAEQITALYCNISKSWLLTGEGSMFLEKKEVGVRAATASLGIPYYGTIDLNTIYSGVNSERIPPLHTIYAPGLEDCDLAITCIGNSMYPDIPAGSILVLKEIDIRAFLPGEIYCIVTSGYSTVKVIRTMDEEDSKIRLVSKNNTAYDDVILDKKDILRLYLVKGTIVVKVF